MAFYNNVIAGAAGQSSGSVSSYEISRSLAFNKSDTPNLTRTPSSDGNRKKWTWSGWVKRGELGGSYALLGAYQNSTRRDVLRFSSDALELQIGTSGGFVSETTSASFKDPGAWYHIVVTYDSTQATAANRVKFYVNGVEQDKTGTPVAQDTLSIINKAVLQVVGARSTDGTASLPFDGCMAEVHFIDGQVLAPTVFGQVSPSTGAWNPIEFSGSYTTTATSTSLSQTGWDPAQEANIWDGDTATRANGYANNQVGTVTFDPPLTNVTKVEVYQQDYVHYLNGSTVTTSETNTEWHVLYNNSSSPITLTSLGNSYTNNTQTVDIFAIRINDSVVDAQTWTPPSSSGIVVQGGGINSYYLKFADNSSIAALGTDSSGQSNTFTVGNLQVVATSGPEVTAAWAGYTGAWSTTDTWSSLSASTGIGQNGGTKGYSSTTETWGGAKTIASGDFGSGIRGGNGWALRYPSSTTITINPGSQTYLSDLVVCPDESTSIANGTSVTTFPATVTGQVFWLRYTGNGYPAADAFGTVTNPPGSLADSLIDSPTNYTADSGNNGGNYCTMNPLDNGQGTQPTFSNGNLETENTGSNVTWTSCRGTIGMKTGKYYFEWTNRYAGGGLYGIANAAASTNPVGTGTGGWTWGGANRYFNGSSGGTSLSNHAVGDVIQIAFDADTGKLWFGRNNTFYDSSWGTTGNPGAGTNNTTSVTTGVDYFPALANLGIGGSSNANPSAFNAGQRPFAYTPPTGYLSLCTQNLPNPTIADGSTAFNVKTWSGDSTERAITGYNLSPDFVWIKTRSVSDEHVLADAVRGGGKVLSSSATNGESDFSDPGHWGNVKTFDSDGFTVDDGAGGYHRVNLTGRTYVGWAWDAGSSNTTNSVGSLNSSVYDQSRTWSDDLSATGLTNETKMFDWTYGYGSYTGTCTWTTTDTAYSNLSGRVYLANNTTLTLGITFKDSNGNSLGTFNLPWTGDGTQMQDTGFDWSSSVASVEITGDYLPVRVQIGSKTIVDTGVTVPNVPSIASTVRANPSTGFSIVTASSLPTTNQTFGHGLNAVPEFIFGKNRAQASQWDVYHKDIGIDKLLRLNSDAAVSSASSGDSTYPTIPTSSVFGFRANGATNNYVWYCFAPVAGYSAFGSYSGNGSNDGPFVYTGFRPRWVLIKCKSDSANWFLHDSVRDPYNPVEEGLRPDLTNATSTTGDRMQFLSNGFKITKSNLDMNGSGRTFVYVAFAEHPLKTARAR